MNEPSGSEARRLGSSYVLDARIGSGAQGEVWRAHNVNAPDETLAVKLLTTDPDDDYILERFLKERATLMRVSSPYVVGVRDMVVEGRTFAIVMTYVDGGDLRGLVSSSGPFAPAETARVGALLARGLAAVHAAGIVHRDVKPANVLIDWDACAPGRGADAVTAVPAGDTVAVGVDTHFTPRLADFGVARLTETISSTHTTASVGTPLYMAPEVLDSRPPTSAADVYSLGIVLYEVACGVTPFTGSAGQVLSQHARRDPGRPDGMPDPLWSVLTSMLIKDPAARPTALEVAQSLETLTTVLAGLPVPAALSTPPASHPSLRPYEWDAVLADGEQATLPSGVGSAGSAGVAVTGGAGAGLSATVDEQVTATQYAGALPVPGGAPQPWGPAPVPSSPSPYGAPSAQSLTPSAPSAVRAPGTRRRRGGLVVAVLVLVIALAGAGTWWWTHRQPEAVDLTALPAPGRATQIQTVADVGRLLVAPGGGALVTSHDGNMWRLHDLSSSNEAPAWEGKCSSATFWNANDLLCHRSGSDGGDILVSLDGTEKAVPGPQKRQLLGASEQTAVVIDGYYSGALVGLGTTGAETWRAYGNYTGGYVDNGFVVTWESDEDKLVVLSADTGTVLLTRALDSEPEWDEPLPGGVGIDVGPQTFYVHDETSGTWSVYGADGALAGEVRTSLRRTGWVASGDLSAQELIELLGTASTDKEAVTVRGARRSVTLTVSTRSCSISADGVALALPERESGETCVLRPLGLVGDDTALLVQVGDADAGGSRTRQLLAADLSDGSTAWSIDAVLAAVLPPSARAGGGLSDLPVLVMQRLEGLRRDLVLAVVAED
ncbi:MULTISPECIES: serine/threonine-protein kinase [Actinomyces]|uniref:non-specific serine/threonine protein kinase n=1 Tax=Actinomyces respiraculi TaxID=2744574 RepID=A0A7T0LJR0_9ACTO|nr:MULTISPECIES: serine/threonine-protein kinase [Actinomyces]QPL05032.1 serine/threonine protein kinase [Actinomyces respiraculi]